MYRVEILNSTEPIYYENVSTIKYIDVLGETVEVSGEDMLTHMFPASRDLHLFSPTENSVITKNSYRQLTIAKCD